MGLFLGIDLGTSYFKAGLFDERGRLKGLGRQYVNKKTANGNICELPVTVFWNTLHACVGEALKNANISPGEIRAASYSSQANSFILFDEKDKPLTPLILWPDNRAEEMDLPLGFLHNGKGFLERTGLGIEPNIQFAIAKLGWFQKKQPQIWRRVKSIHSISDYLTFVVTGQKISDVSTASMTGLLDIAKCQWWDKSMELNALSSKYFSFPQRIGSYVGPLTESGAQLIGLTKNTRYYLGGLDHHCAAIGSGLIQNSNLCESTGTVLSCVGYSLKYSPKINQCIAPGLAAGHYFKMAFDDNGARPVEWYQKMFAPALDIPELLKMAGEVNGSEGLVARPSANKFQGMSGFYNIRPEHGHGHFVRALLESTANSLNDLVQVVKEPDFRGGIISTGGGAQSNLWVKIKSNLLKTVFYIPVCSETACMGAAMIGAVGTGESGNWEETVNDWVRFSETVQPDAIEEN